MKATAVEACAAARAAYEAARAAGKLADVPAQQQLFVAKAAKK